MKKNGELPDDMPFNPHKTYKNTGWRGWRHFLGTLKMMSFHKAQNYVLNQAEIETIEELIEWLKSENRPLNFPEEPHTFYEQWTNAREFLQIRDSNKMTYAESKQYIQSLQFRNEREAIQWLKSDERPEELPVDPHIFYSKEWEGWNIYLGLIPTVENLFERIFKKDTNDITLDIQEIDHAEELMSSDEYNW